MLRDAYSKVWMSEDDFFDVYTWLVFQKMWHFYYNVSGALHGGDITYHR
jgi:hypothetical protein